MNLCHAQLIAASPFYDLFEGGRAPIKTLFATEALLEGVGAQAVYFLDPAALTPAQVEAVARRVAEVFSADIEAVRAELLERGLPIRATQTTGISFPVRLLS